MVSYAPKRTSNRNTISGAYWSNHLRFHKNEPANDKTRQGTHKMMNANPRINRTPCAPEAWARL